MSVYAGAQLLRTRSAVLYKLVLFALLMAVVPIATYFGTLNYLWDGALCLWFPVPSMPLQTPGRMSLADFCSSSFTLRRLHNVCCHLCHRRCQPHPRGIRRRCL